MMNRLLQDKIYIVDALRTPIGGAYKGLSSFTATQLAAIVIKNILKRNKLKKNQIDQVILGNVVSAGLGQNFSRQAAILGGLDVQTQAYTVNNVCGSGLQAVILGVQSILCNDSELVICGGSESATHTPLLVFENKENNKKDFYNSLIRDGLTCQLTQKLMGELIELLVKKYKISRVKQDEYSLESHRKALLAQRINAFHEEIIPIGISNGKIMDQDDRVRKNVTIDSFAGLPPAFGKNGTVTAGNASASSDGAAGCVLASEKQVKKLRLKPLARIKAYNVTSADPKITFETAVFAIKDILKISKLNIKDIDLFEVGEAFAAQMIHIREQLRIPTEKLNIYGGDIAFGHPLGAAGIRILVTLIHALRLNKLRRGLACISYGGGGAIAIIVETI